MNPVLRSQLLELYPVLKDVSKEHLDEALAGAEMYHVKAGTLMWEESEQFFEFPFVIKGVGRVYKIAPNGRELHLYSVGPGDDCPIAIGSLVNGTKSHARAICEQDYEIVLLPQPVFKKLISQSEVFRDYALNNLSEQLSTLTEMVTAIVFQNLDQRLAGSLIAKPNPIKATHQNLADELGSVREIISRILKNFEARGWIELQRGQINILKPQNLSEFSTQYPG